MAYSSIVKPTDYFNTVLYAGNDSTNNITGVGFQPDWVWIKNRSNSSSHNIFDSVRGATKAIFTNATDAEATEASRLSAFNSDGFTLNGDTSNQTNANGSNFVSFNWKAGGSASSNGDGSITSTVSANTTSGFSIVSYTGTGSVATVGHGLGAAPKLIIVKTRSLSGEAWPVDSRAASGIVYLNETGAKGSYGDSSPFPSTAPTSTVFSIGTPNNTNGSGATYIAYCFAEKQGYSKFGSYTGNGSTDGTFVHTGFRPAFVINKRTDSSTGGSWILQDNKRGNNVRNPVDLSLSPTNNQTESDWGDTFDCDYVSNGFKWRMDGTGGYNNTSGATYIYLAFAEHPFVGNDSGTAVPVVAR